MYRDEIFDLGIRFEQAPASGEVDKPASIAIGEDGKCAQLENRQHGGKGGNRTGENQVAGLAFENSQGNLDGIQSACYSDGMRNSPKRSQAVLEIANPLAQDIPATGSDQFRCVEHVFANVGPLPLKIVTENHLPTAARNSA